MTSTSIDLGDQTTWSTACLDYVDSVIAELDERSERWRSCSVNDLWRELGHIDRRFEIEVELRSDVLVGSRVQLFHFTRLLPEEVDVIEHDGLTPLTVRTFEERIRLAGERHGLDRVQVEALIRRSPVHDDADAREGKIWGVAPLRSAADGADEGLTCFLDTYGGEATYWDSTHLSGLRRLTELSSPTIVAFSAEPLRLNETQLWTVLVAQRVGRNDAWHEWYATTPVAACWIHDVIVAGHPLWPYD